MDLVYLGVSLKNHINHPLEDKIFYCDAATLNRVKVSHDEYPLLLDTLKNFDFVKELTLISTCNRFELIMFWNKRSVTQENILEVNRAINSINKSDVELGALVGDDARFQVLRTYAGLNSGLIGENEISMQMQISFQQSRHMEYLAENGMQLLDDATNLRKIIDNYIYREGVSYCDVGIQKSLEKFSTSNFNKVVVLGSGSTAHKACQSLVSSGVPAEKITLCHRISYSSDQIASFKNFKAFEGMTFFRTKYGYHTDKAKDLVADADLLIFGIDSKNPVMNFNKNYKQKIIDFNSKPSCTFEDGADLSNFVSSSQLDGYVREFSVERCQDQAFQSRLFLAETILEDAALTKDLELARQV